MPRMATLNNMPSRNTINTLGRAVDFYVLRGKTPVVRKFPQWFQDRLDRAERPDQYWLKFITQAASECDLSVTREGMSITDESGWTWRDAVVSASYGNLLRQRVGIDTNPLTPKYKLVYGFPLNVVKKVSIFWTFPG